MTSTAFYRKACLPSLELEERSGLRYEGGERTSKHQSSKMRDADNTVCNKLKMTCDYVRQSIHERLCVILCLIDLEEETPLLSVNERQKQFPPLPRERGLQRDPEVMHPITCRPPLSYETLTGTRSDCMNSCLLFQIWLLKTPHTHIRATWCLLGSTLTSSPSRSALYLQNDLLQQEIKTQLIVS